MRKIIFNTETIDSIRSYINDGHTIKETCNHFTLKPDTLRRIMYENNISSSHPEKVSCKKEIDQDLVNQVCSLFEVKNMRMEDICSELKLKNYVVQDIIHKHFTQKEIDDKHKELYRQSKLGSKNPCFGKTREESTNYKGGEVSDGKGYLMRLRPEWYTGRVGKKYVFSHHVVYCEAVGITEIPSGFIIHHIDGNKLNNDISNLAMMTVAAHSKLHSIENKLCKVQRLSRTGVGDNSEAPNIDCE